MDPSKNDEYIVTMHDPCNVVRKAKLKGFHPIDDDARFVLSRIVNNYVEPDPARENNFCCSGGGGALINGFARGSCVLRAGEGGSDQTRRGDPRVHAVRELLRRNRKPRTRIQGRIQVRVHSPVDPFGQRDYSGRQGIRFCNRGGKLWRESSRSTRSSVSPVEVEKRGEAFYKSMAAKAKDSNVKETLTYLAGEEVKHQKTFQDMLGKLSEMTLPAGSTEDEYWGYVNDLIDSHFLFNDVLNKKMTAAVSSDTDALHLAMGFEKDSILFFYGDERPCAVVRGIRYRCVYSRGENPLEETRFRYEIRGVRSGRKYGSIGLKTNGVRNFSFRDPFFLRRTKRERVGTHQRHQPSYVRPGRRRRIMIEGRLFDNRYRERPGEHFEDGSTVVHDLVLEITVRGHDMMIEKVEARMPHHPRGRVHGRNSLDEETGRHTDRRRFYAKGEGTRRRRQGLRASHESLSRHGGPPLSRESGPRTGATARSGNRMTTGSRKSSIPAISGGKTAPS